jgi:hypothetical protein
MPSPGRLTAERSFNFNGLRLSPPPRGAPPVSAAKAWEAVRGLHTGATYKLVLAEANSGVALDGPSRSPLLVWMIMGSDVAVPLIGGFKVKGVHASCVRVGDEARRRTNRCGVGRVDVPSITMTSRRCSVATLPSALRTTRPVCTLRL